MRAPTVLDTPCIEWDKHILPTGYGSRKFRGRMMSAHRASWIEHNGPIPGGLFVLHKCDNPPCVNPEHLWLGTQTENIRDAVSKGRMNGTRNAGENNHFVKLTKAQVSEMREMHASGGVSFAELARIFNVTKSNAWMVVARKTWQSI